MECKHWNETWVVYLYDECPADERDAIDAHLSACESCRERMDSLDETRRDLQSAAPENVRTAVPSLTFHVRAVLSAPPVSNCFPSLLNASDVTGPSWPTINR